MAGGQCQFTFVKCTQELEREQWKDVRSLVLHSLYLHELEQWAHIVGWMLTDDLCTIIHPVKPRGTAYMYTVCILNIFGIYCVYFMIYHILWMYHDVSCNFNSWPLYNYPPAKPRGRLYTIQRISSTSNCHEPVIFCVMMWIYWDIYLFMCSQNKPLDWESRLFCHHNIAIVQRFGLIFMQPQGFTNVQSGEINQKQEYWISITDDKSVGP